MQSLVQVLVHGYRGSETVRDPFNVSLCCTSLAIRLPSERSVKKKGIYIRAHDSRLLAVYMARIKSFHLRKERKG